MFTGSIVAIVTPFKDGKFDQGSLKQLIEFQIKNGMAGILSCGCTGEPATLSMDEHKKVIDYTIEIVNGRVPVLAGTGSNNTEESIELTEYAQKAGASGALIITPYYNKPTPSGLYEHYKKIAERVPIPIILYNVPSRTGISILPETVAKLAELKNVVGIKEASGSVDQVSEILRICPEDFVVLSGDDSLTLPIMSVGGQGVISVAANIIPDRVSEMVNSALSGNWEKARKIHLDIFPIFKILFIETNPIPVKSVLGLMGMIVPEWRLPLTPPLPESLEKIKQVLKNCGVINDI